MSKTTMVCWYPVCCMLWETQARDLKDVRTQKFPRTDFFVSLPHRKVIIYLCQKGKKNGGSSTSFWKEHARKYRKSEKLGFVS